MCAEGRAAGSHRPSPPLVARAATGYTRPMADAPDSLWQQALRVIPGGVNSPVRAFRAVGGEPFFV